MSAPRRGRGKSSFILPLAITATAAVASLGLYLWLGDGDKEKDSQKPSHRLPERRSSRRGRERERSQYEHDRITEVDESELEAEERRRRGKTVPRRQPDYVSQQQRQQQPQSGSKKREVAIVISERGCSASGLLRQLEGKLNVKNTQVFILIYSPQMKTHPLSVVESGDPDSILELEKSSSTYAHAATILPKDYPREFILPYSKATSVVPLLRQLGPEVVYLEEDLAGDEGAVVAGVLDGGWVGGVTIVVDEQGGKGKGRGGWWAAEDVGVRRKFGKRCRVLEQSEVGEDWTERVDTRV